MKLKNQLPLQRLIAKIDNDFNISESDWIPRVAAWVIDALSQMQVLPMEKKRRKLEVSERLAQFPCQLNAKELKIYDSNGCEISEYSSDNFNGCSCGNYSRVFSSSNSDSQEIAIFDSSNKTGVNFMKVANITNGTSGKYFVLSGNTIELSFDTDYITVETFETATYFDDYYQCDVPYIYDNGLLLEALAWYVLFKYLSRGSHHQVFNLKDANSPLNPYNQWILLKPKAANKVAIELSRNKDGWNNFFYNSTFLPRN